MELMWRLLCSNNGIKRRTNRYFRGKSIVGIYLRDFIKDNSGLWNGKRVLCLATMGKSLYIWIMNKGVTSFGSS